MKRTYRRTMLLGLLLPMMLVLGGCGAYARSPNSSSGIDTYGVIDVGVQHGSR